MCLIVLGIIAPVISVGAQTRSSDPLNQSPCYIEIATGAAVGHRTSDALINIEAAMRLEQGVAIFVEGGRVGDVGTANLDARARRIADAIGATADAGYRITYADAGLRVRLPFPTRVEPYISEAIGAARVRTETVFSSNGTRIDPTAHGSTPIGPDLDGSVTKLMMTWGAGAQIPITTHIIGDLSARFSRILAKGSLIADDDVINLLRLQAGVGVRF
jgi:opacity protein-like surface antigen